jgi:pimeloyl-ACP methyl ester carboxylesterase
MSRERTLHRIVLVHGALHGAWCWEELTPLLQMRGFKVDTLDLPGLGDDPTPPKYVTFQSYVERIVETVTADPGPTLLLGHSLGGAPVSQAAEDAPQGIGKLIYLAAHLPVDGESLGAMGEIASHYDEPSASGGMGPSDMEGAHGFAADRAFETFYNCCDTQTARRAQMRLRPQANAPLFTPVRLTAPRWGAIPKTYIVCTQDRALPPGAQHFMCGRNPDVRKRVMDSDHSPFFSDPTGLADIIEEEASI